MILEIKKRKFIILIAIFIFLIIGSITIYFVIQLTTKPVLPKTQQDTIYIDQKGNQQTTNEHDLSNINCKEIFQIGFYKNKSEEIQVVKMPNLIQRVPDQLPPEITNTNFMFLNCKMFNKNISSWNTSNVKNMNCMFQNASIFNQDISNWNVKNVTQHYNFADNTIINGTNKLPKFNN